MKKLLVMAVAAFMAVSCADNKIDAPAHPVSDAVAFDASTLRSTRATLTNANVSAFQVYAALNDESLYMDNVRVKREEKDGATIWTYNPLVYWPNEGFLNFYAAATKGRSETETTTFYYDETTCQEFYVNHVSGDVSSKNLVKGSRDVAYAVNMNETKKSSAVQMFFRHAGAQIVFQFAHRNPKYEDIQVYVEDIYVVNLTTSGRYILPRETTTKDNTSALGRWDLDVMVDKLAEQGFDVVNAYDVDIVPQEVPYNTEAVVTYDKVMQKSTYTSTDGAVYEDDGHLNIIPQNVVAWDKTNEGSKTQMYLLVKVNYTQKSNGYCLWPEGAASTTETEWVSVPLNAPTAWEQGKRYIYTLEFPGGLTPPVGPDDGPTPPDPDPTPETEPEPVLQPITFDLLIDEWVEAPTIDVDDFQNVGA